MPRKIVFTSNAAKPPAACSQAVKAAGLVFVSRTAPQDPAPGTIMGATIPEQTRQCLANISCDPGGRRQLDGQDCQHDDHPG